MQLRERIVEKQNEFFIDDIENAALKSLLWRINRILPDDAREVIDQLEGEQLLACSEVINAIDMLSQSMIEVGYRSGEYTENTAPRDMFRRGASVALYALSHSMEAPFYDFFPRLTQSFIRASTPVSPYTRPLKDFVVRYGHPGYTHMHSVETRQTLDGLFEPVIPFYLRTTEDTDSMRFAYEVGAGIMLAARNLYDDEREARFFKAGHSHENFQQAVGEMLKEIKQIYNENA